MDEQKKYLFERDSERLQITYSEYVDLIEKAKEANRVQDIAKTVALDLKSILNGSASSELTAAPVEQAPVEIPAEESQDHEKVSVESEADDQNQLSEPEAVVEPQDSEAVTEPQEPEAVVEQEAEQQPAANGRGEVSEVPPIKNEISEHFNRLDESGRLFNIFKQYYTCLNEMCGGTVRVTMKDGFCSLWNYDEWEEFSFVDIFEDQLRIAIDPRYTDELKSQNLCEVPRLLSSRRNLICVKVEDLNNTVLDVLAKAFAEVGMQVG